MRKIYKPTARSLKALQKLLVDENLVDVYIDAYDVYEIDPRVYYSLKRERQKENPKIQPLVEYSTQSGYDNVYYGYHIDELREFLKTRKYKIDIDDFITRARERAKKSFNDMPVYKSREKQRTGSLFI